MILEWVLRISYFALLGGSLILLLFLLAGRISPKERPNQQQTNRYRDDLPVFVPIFLGKHVVKAGMHTSTEDFRPIRALFRNPRQMWATDPIETPVGIKQIPFPVFRWWALFDQLDPAYVKRLGLPFLELFGDEITGARVYAGSSFAMDFLNELRDELSEKKTSVYLLDKFHPPPPAAPKQRIVLFDISFSTGATIRAAMNRVVERGEKPDVFLCLVLNDLVPPTRHGAPWAEIDAKLEFLYKTSDLIQYWSDKKGIVDALLIVHEAMEGNRDWEDSRVEQAIQTLRTVFN